MNEFMLRQFIESLEETVDGGYTSTDIFKVETALREFCLKHGLAPHQSAVWTVGGVQELLRGCTSREMVHTELRTFFGTLSTEKVDAFLKEQEQLLGDYWRSHVWPMLVAVDYDAIDDDALVKRIQEAGSAAHAEARRHMINVGRFTPRPQLRCVMTCRMHNAAFHDAKNAFDNAMCEFRRVVREDHLYQPNTTTLFKRTLNGTALRVLEDAAKSFSTVTPRIQAERAALRRDAEEERVDDAVRRVHEVLAQLPPHDRLHEIEAAVDELADARRKRARDA